jgi:hypothetical protein
LAAGDPPKWPADPVRTPTSAYPGGAARLRPRTSA